MRETKSVKPVHFALFFLLITNADPIGSNSHPIQVRFANIELAPSSAVNIDSLSILTINLWGLPIRLPGQAQRKRFKKIPQAINTQNFDIICMQEVFSKRLRKRILRNLSEGYNYFSNYKCNRSILGPMVKDCFGGLMTISKYPIVAESFFEYPTFEGMRLEERIGQKGFLLSSIRIDGKVVHVINTHLYAGPSERDEGFRMKQIQYMDSVLTDLEFIHNDPVFLLGDLNVRHPALAVTGHNPASKTYGHLIANMGFRDEQLYHLNDQHFTINEELNAFTKTKNGKQKLDYILYRQASNVQINASEQFLVFKEANAISDHLGLGAYISIQSQPSLESSPKVESVVTAALK